MAVGSISAIMEDPEVRNARLVEEAKASHARKLAAEAAAEEARVRRAEAEYERNCGERQVPMAFVMIQKPVRAKLRSPSTASFPYKPTVGMPLDKCRFRITSYVDAQNGFGAMIRTPWTGVIEYLPDTNRWRAHEIRVGG